MKSNKKLILVLWLSFLVLGLGYYILHPELFTAQQIATFLSSYGDYLLVVYFMLSTVRGLTLVPSTPLVLAGSILFPTKPIVVLCISMIGILLSAILLYFFSSSMGFDKTLEKKFPSAIQFAEKHLGKAWGSFIVFFWSFFPGLPTDAICYVAGTVKMNFAKYLVAVFAGEFIICYSYIYFGGELMKLFS